jgi:hypothetical protein
MWFSLKTKIRFAFPLGAIASIAIFIYLISSEIWYQLSFALKFLVIIALTILFFCGEFEYSKERNAQ